MNKCGLILGSLALAVFLMSATTYAADAVLTWNPNSESDLAGYKVYFAPQACSVLGPLAPLMVNGAPVVLGTVITYRHVNLPVIDGTLCWELTAFDTSGNESPRSQRVSKQVNLVPPQAPTGLDAAVQ